MLRLFNDDGSGSEDEIKTNSEYATHYNIWRQKEELNKLKTKYGDVKIDDDDYDSESSSSDEDEDGVALTEEFEKDFFKTLACLKKKDPKIYDSDTRFFKPIVKDGDQTKLEIKKEKKKDPLLLKNYEKKMLLRTGGKFEEDEDSEDKEEENYRSRSPTYVEEQQRLKESFKKALNDNDKDENNWGGLFQKRTKSKEESQQEEDDYTKWLKGQKKELDNKDIENELVHLKDYWNDPKLANDEAFLRDYLLNKRYLDKPDKDYIPTYEEIIHDSDEGLSEDEENIDQQEEFETKYNHRYEEPDTEYIKRYPRTMANSVRKTDDRRKVKRAEIKERKEEEKKQKHEDLKQLKVLKKREIEEKIKKLKDITGNYDLEFQDQDLEEDFDPEAHDRRMQEIFNDQYYGGEEGDQKPEFPDLEEELGPWVNDNEPHCEDDNFVMDCDFDPSAANKDKDKGKKKRNRFDKKGKKIEKSEVENDERYSRYMEELNQYDCEDMIGDLPCRFKYREVIPNSFGLSIEEILIAKDRELNRWCSLKKATQHRPEHVERYDVVAFEKKASNEALKKKVLASLYEELEEPKVDEYIKKIKKDLNPTEDVTEQNEDNEKNDENVVTTEVKDKKKKKKNSSISLNDAGDTAIEEIKVDNKNTNDAKKERNKKKKKSSILLNTTDITEDINNILNEIEIEKTTRGKNAKDMLNDDENDILNSINEDMKYIGAIDMEVKDTNNYSVTKKNKKKNNKLNDFSEILLDEPKTIAELKYDNETVIDYSKKKNKRKKKNSEASEIILDQNKNLTSKDDEKTDESSSPKKNNNGKHILNESTEKLEHSAKTLNEYINTTTESISKNTSMSKLSRRQKKNKRKLMQNFQKQASGPVTIKSETEESKVSKKNKRKGKMLEPIKTDSDTQERNEVGKKNKRKRKNSETISNGQSPTKKFKQNKKKNNKTSGQNGMNFTDSRLEAYGINPKKYKNKLKFKKQK